MSDTNFQDLKVFETRVRQLMFDYKSLREENAALKEKIEKLEADLGARKQEVLSARKSYEELKLAKMISISTDDVDEAKQKIARLVREVEKCISLINV